MSASLSPTIAELQASFVAILPRIETIGHVYFCHVTCPGKREDAIAEMVALSWRWFVRLHEKGKEPLRFISAIATFAARAVKSGRRVCGQDKTKDVLSPLAQQRWNFAVGKLPDFSTVSDNPMAEALTDNTQTPVPDQVSFRCDFPAWIKTRTQRDLRVIEALMTGERTSDVASKHGLTSARISQLRRDFREDWERFCEPNAG